MTHLESQTVALDFWLPWRQSQCDIIMADPGSEEELERSTRPARTTYRPKFERDKLEALLISWRLKVHSEDPGTALFPLEDILCSQDVINLARLPVNSSYISSSASITDFLEQSEDWGSIYATEIKDIIANYNSSLPSKQKPARKSQSGTPATVYPDLSAYCNIIDTKKSMPTKRKSDQVSQAGGSNQKRLKHVPLDELSTNAHF